MVPYLGVPDAGWATAAGSAVVSAKASVLPCKPGGELTVTVHAVLEMHAWKLPPTFLGE